MKEIKSIYIAGKMKDTYWRKVLFDKDDNPPECLHNEYQVGRHPITIETGDCWPKKSRLTICGLDYTGPFFVDLYDGHGNDDFGDDEHGDNIDSGYPHYHAGSTRETRQSLVQQWCLDAIQRADLFVAWIDCIDCYGTIAEIGYAKALGKIIWIYGPMRYRDLWFVYRMADDCCFSRDSLDFLRRNIEEYQRIHRHFDSPIEEAFWEQYALLTDYCPPLDLVPQYPIGKYRVDFAHERSKTAIELDGHATHSSPDAIAYDRKRQRYIESQGWHVIRFGGKEVYNDASIVAKEVYDFLARHSKSSPRVSWFRYSSGDKVRHDKFGEGVVLKSEIEANTEFVEVQFQGKHGTKRLSMDFAKLEKILPDDKGT